MIILRDYAHLQHYFLGVTEGLTHECAGTDAKVSALTAQHSHRSNLSHAAGLPHRNDQQPVGYIYMPQRSDHKRRQEPRGGARGDVVGRYSVGGLASRVGRCGGGDWKAHSALAAEQPET